MSHRIRVNPIACTAHGMCAELLPERITLDEWGYPIIIDPEISGDLIPHARRAAAACPTLALLHERERTDNPGRVPPSDSSNARGGRREARDRASPAATGRPAS